MSDMIRHPASSGKEWCQVTESIRTTVAASVLIIVLFGASLPIVSWADEQPSSVNDQECIDRGYVAADAFPSIGVAMFELHWAGVFGLPNQPPGPLGSSGPILVEFDEGDGDTVVCRAPPEPPGCEEDCTLEVEIIELELLGSHPVLGEIRVGVDPRIPSPGLIEGASVDPQGNVFNGDSFFDVFVDVQIDHPTFGEMQAGTCLDPNQPDSFFCMPFRVEADLTDVTLPPVQGVSYRHPVGRDVPLWVDPDPDDPEGEFIVGALLGGCHKPYDPAIDEHHVCLMGAGTTTPDPTGKPCLENVVQLYAVDLSLPDHNIVAVTSTTIGPLATTPWTATTLGGVTAWTASAVTNVEQCAEVGLAVSAVYADLHPAPETIATWLQHA